MDNVVASVLVVFMVWACLYLLLCLVWTSRSYEWNVRAVTLLHAALVSYLSWICSYNYGPWPFTDPGPTMLFHHLLSIAGLATAVWTGAYGCEVVAVICGTEVTNPLLQLRWFLKEIGHYNTLLGEVVDLLFMTLFGTMRLGVGSYLLFTYMTNPNTDYMGRAGGLLIYLVGWIFWVSIVQFAIKKYSRLWNKRKISRSGEAEAKTDSTPVTSCDGCRESQSVACVQRVNKVIQDITKNSVDQDTVEAIRSLSTSTQDSIKRSINT